MYLRIAHFLLQLSLVLGAPTTDVSADIPACAQCQWDPATVSEYQGIKDDYIYNENIKIIKKADGCIQADFTCTDKGYVDFMTQDGEKYYYYSFSSLAMFKGQFNTTLTCDGKSPYWKLQSNYPLYEREPKGVIKALFCKTENKTQ